MKKTLSINESRVLNMIPRTSEKPILISEIARVMHISWRSVASIIETLVMDYGVPIVSKRSGKENQKGVYIATSDIEREYGLLSLRSQVAENLKRIKKVEHADLENWEKELQVQTDLDAALFG